MDFPFNSVYVYIQILFDSLSSAQNFLVSVFINDNGDQNGFFKLTFPAVALIDVAYVDIWIVPALVPPFLNVDIGLFVEFTDCRRENPAALEGFRNIFDPAYRYDCQIHFDQRLFHAAFPAAISFKDGSFKSDFPSDAELSGLRLRAVIISSRL